MTDLINKCSYGPNPQSVNPLTERKVERLNSSGAYDIRARVKTIITKHLNFNGEAEYTLQIQKTKITFAANGQTRTLEKQSNNQWKLCVNGTETTPTAQTDIDHDIADTLTKIRTVTDGAFPEAPRSTPPQNTHSPEVLRHQQQTTEQLEQINQSLQNLKDNPALERTLETLQTTLTQLERQVATPPPPSLSPEILDLLARNQEETSKKLDAILQALLALAEAPKPEEKSRETEEMVRNFKTYVQQLEQNNARMYAHLETEQRTIADLKNQLEQAKSQLSRTPPAENNRLQQALDTLSRQQDEMNRQLQGIQSLQISSLLQPKIAVHPELVMLPPESVPPSTIPFIDSQIPEPAHNHPSELQQQLISSASNLNTAFNGYNHILEIAGLKSDLKEATADQQEKQQQLDKNDQSIQQLQNNIEQLISQSKALEAQKANLEKSLAEKSSQIADLEARSRALEQNLQEATEREKGLRNQLTEANLLQQESKQKIEEQTKTITALNNQLTEAQKTLEANSQQIQTLQQDKAGLEKSLVEKVLEVGQLKAQIKDLQTSSRTTQEENKKTIKALQEKEQQLSDEIKQLRTLHRATQATLDTTTQKLEAANAQITTERDQYQTQVTNLTHQLALAEQLHQASQKTIEEQSSQIKNLEAQGRQTAAETKDLAEQIARLNYQIKGLWKEQERLLGVIRSKEERIKKLGSQESFDL